MTDDGQVHVKKTTSSLLQYGVMFALLWLIFFRILPNLIDYQAVWDTILSLELWQFGVLLVLAAMRDFSESAVYTKVVPGLGYWPGWQVYEASTSMASLAPPGIDFAIRYGMYRSFGVPAAITGQAMLLSAVFTLGLKWSLPAIALILVLISGPAGWEPSTLFWLILAVCASIVMAGAGILRSEQIARWIGRQIQYWNNRFLVGRWKFHEIAGMEERLVGWRNQTIGTLGSVWPKASAFAIASQTFSFVTLVMAMRFVGVSGTEASIFEIFVAFSIGLIASMIPILPQGVGAVELVYVAILAGEVGTDLADQIAAAAFTHRIFMWFLPMLVGIIPLVMWRRRVKRDPTAHPLGDFAAE